MNITDEMVWRGVAAVAVADAAIPSLSPRQAGVVVRAALEAVAGDIAKQVGEEIAQAIDAKKPHIPVSTDPQRRTRIIERCTLNAAARIAREIGAGNGE